MTCAIYAKYPCGHDSFALYVSGSLRAGINRSCCSAHYYQPAETDWMASAIHNSELPGITIGPETRSRMSNCLPGSVEPMVNQSPALRSSAQFFDLPIFLICTYTQRFHHWYQQLFISEFLTSGNKKSGNEFPLFPSSDVLFPAFRKTPPTDQR